MTPDAAELGAVAEAVERACLMSSGADDPRAVPPPAANAVPAAETFWQYSDIQLHATLAHRYNSAAKSCGYAVDSLWMNGVDLGDGAVTTLPATAVLADEDIRLGLPPVLCSSSGAAVRDTFAAATERAVLERVERDQVAIWWYNRLPAPRIAADAALASLPEALAGWLAGRSRRTHHLMMPSDLPVPAVVALSARADGSRPAIGAAAALDPAAAILAATLEMIQGEIALSLMRSAQRDRAAPPVPPLLAWSAAASVREPHLAGAGTASLPPPTTFAALRTALAGAGIKVFVADLTRPEFGIPVARAVSPDLRDWQKRFAPGRLFDVPVALGLLMSPTPVAALNPVAFPI